MEGGSGMLTHLREGQGHCLPLNPLHSRWFAAEPAAAAAAPPALAARGATCHRHRKSVHRQATRVTPGATGAPILKATGCLLLSFGRIGWYAHHRNPRPLLPASALHARQVRCDDFELRVDQETLLSQGSIVNGKISRCELCLA